MEAGEIIPADGEIIEGVASVNESAITGESAPVIRESGGDRSAVTGGTLLVSDWLVIRVTADPGRSFLDRMIAMVEGAERQKTPNEVALDILLAGFTLIFLFVVVTLEPFALFSGTSIAMAFLIALFVTLIPTTIGGLLSAIGIAGMDRLVKANVIAKSGRAVEAAGDVDTLLLDKTGTITFGNRMADAFLALPGVPERELAEAALLASLSDDTPEGKSIVDLARKLLGAAEPRRAWRVRAVHGADPALGRKPRGRDRGAQGRQRRAPRACRREAATSRSSRSSRGSPSPAARRWWWRGRAGAGRCPPQGHRQARHPRALRRAPGDGDPDGDDHRRQPADGGGDRGGGGGGRLPRRGDAREEAGTHPRRAGEGKLVAMCGDGSNDAPALAIAMRSTIRSSSRSRANRTGGSRGPRQGSSYRRIPGCRSP